MEVVEVGGSKKGRRASEGFQNTEIDTPSSVIRLWPTL